MKKQILSKPGRRILIFAVSAAMIFTFAAVPTAAAYSPESLVPVGRTVGIKLYADGVIVLGLSPFDTPRGAVCPAKDAGICVGDVILSVENQKVTTTDGLQSALSGRAGKETALEILRGDGEISVTVVPEADPGGNVRIGASVRDSMAGIGTLTYYDPETQTFGALGHGICDGNTGMLVHLGSGCLVPSSVIGVQKGISGEPGELLGVFDSENDCGRLAGNTDCGLFGTLDSSELYPELLCGNALPVKNSAEKGRAYILSNISGGEVRQYEIEIVKTVNFERSTKNFFIRVIDPVLLEATGGIVQGMSGSPIIQNGCIVGAVTHVLVNDPTCGYGILIGNMLNASAGVSAAFAAA
ncbi:MAG: SpoIVB peptidase [Clostridiales bacterium]|nr:SpoIVB peptidase [Clostridiales bacterium]